MRNLFILGFPGLYGGAGTELHHQIIMWSKCFKDIKLHIIPMMVNYENEPLYKEMVSLGVEIHGVYEFEHIHPEDAIINFCSGEYLDRLELINQFTDRVMWVNCMTGLFDKEKEAASKNLIKYFLYQRNGVLTSHQYQLQKLGSNGYFMHFWPYFDSDGFDFNVIEQERINIGRISRQDTDKYSSKTLHIYEYITSPRWKQGHFLGFDHRSQQKIGKPFDWIKTYRDQKDLSVKDFYKTVDFIVQPMDTTENWPRIGLEAMHSGKVLIVDNRGGWQSMIKHGKTGFLCDKPQDFIYWGTRMAYEFEHRREIANNAASEVSIFSGLELSSKSWKKIFDKVYA